MISLSSQSHNVIKLSNDDNKINLSFLLNFAEHLL